MLTATLKQITEQMPAWFRGSVTGAAVLAEQQRAEEGGRRAAIADIAAARTAYHSTRPTLTAALEKETAAVRKLELALQAGQRRLLAAHGAREAARHAVDAVVNRHAGYLRDTQPAVIVEFIAELERQQAQIRRGLQEHEETTLSLEAPTGRERRLVTNSADVGRRLKLLATIRQQANDWHLQVATSAEGAELIGTARRRLALPFDGPQAA